MSGSNYSNSTVSSRSLPSSPISSPKEDSNIYTPHNSTPSPGSGSNSLALNVTPFPSRQPVERPRPIKYIFPNIGVDRFSSHHPMIPRHYVPPWQLDMKNRYRIIENCQDANVKTCWGGHISYFWEKRERLNATSHEPYPELSDESKRRCYSLSSHFSKYNPSQMYYYS